MYHHPAPADTCVSMIYSRHRNHQSLPGGHFTFQNGRNRVISGPGDGDYIFLRDEHGNQWRGMAERQADDTIRYRFRDDAGNSISGFSDGCGITLRDQKGLTWRGFVN